MNGPHSHHHSPQPPAGAQTALETAIENALAWPNYAPSTNGHGQRNRRHAASTKKPEQKPTKTQADGGSEIVENERGTVAHSLDMLVPLDFYAEQMW